MGNKKQKQTKQKKANKNENENKKQRKKYSVKKFALDSQSFHWDLNPT